MALLNVKQSNLGIGLFQEHMILLKKCGKRGTQVLIAVDSPS
jgi:hypothetical protein